MKALDIVQKNLRIARQRSMPDEFQRNFEAVMDHYKMTPEEREAALNAAHMDYARASECYRSIAQSLKPEVKSKFGLTAMPRN